MPAAAHHISAVDVRAGMSVDNLRFHYADRLGRRLGTSPWFGSGTGGQLSRFHTAPNDHLARITVWYRTDGVVDRIQLANRYGRFVGTYGVQTGNAQATMTFAGHQIVGFHGRAGNLIDALGVKLRPTSGSGTYREYGTGCAGATPVAPRHFGSGPPNVGFFFDWEVRSFALAAGALLVGPASRNQDLTAFGLPGCTLLTAPVVFLPFRANIAGAARITVNLRDAPLHLAGATVYTQAVVRDRNTSRPVPVLMSGGLATRIGL